MNIVAMSGRLVEDVELRQSKAGKPYCTLTIAVQKPKDHKEVDFFDCIAGGQTAEFLAKYGKKGDAFEIYGALTLREFTDKNNVKRRKPEILINSMSFALTRNARPADNDLDFE